MKTWYIQIAYAALEDSAVGIIEMYGYTPIYV